MLLSLLVTLGVAAAQRDTSWYYVGGRQPNRAYTYGVHGNSFMASETPIQVYDTAIWDIMNWGCISSMSSDYLDALTQTDPVLRGPAGYDTARHRVSCAQFAKYHVLPLLYPANVQWHIDDMVSSGYAAYTSDMMKNDVRACLDGSSTGTCLQAMLSNIMMNGGADLEVCALFGAIVGHRVADHMRQDGFNANGKMSANGRTCTKNCSPYRDYTGYRPVNQPGYPLADETRWQPLTETNDLGFFSAQDHVTPQLTQAPLIAVPQAWKSRQAPPPNYDYGMLDMDPVNEVAKLAGDDMKKMMIEYMDVKFLILDDIGGSIGLWHSFSYEQRCLWHLGYTATELDAVVMVWKEKIRHDAIRPTSRVQGASSFNGTSTMMWYDGTMVDREDWTPYIRVMPHAEYPSGSAGICQTICDYTNAWARDTAGGAGQDAVDSKTGVPKRQGWESQTDAGETTVKYTKTFKMGSSNVDMSVPAMDISHDFKSVNEAAKTCMESRLWGGMHYRPSLQAAQDLVQGFGAEAYAFTKRLRAGMPLPTMLPGDGPPTPAPTLGANSCRDIKHFFKTKTPQGMADATDACNMMPGCKAKVGKGGKFTCSKSNLSKHCKSLDEAGCMGDMACKSKMDGQGVFKSCSKA